MGAGGLNEVRSSKRGLKGFIGGGFPKNRLFVQALVVVIKQKIVSFMAFFPCVVRI